MMLNVYDMNRRKTAVLQNAFSITETKELNQIYTLTFNLPATDEKAKYLQPFHYIRYGEDGELYRIIKISSDDSDTPILSVSCEHVIAVLCDDLMFGSFTYGGKGVPTKDTIKWLLDQQKTQNWKLGTCAFTRYFEYNWEQENILNALYSIPKEFSKAYKWTFDTVSYPWKLSLTAIDETINETINPEYYIRAKRNLLSSGTDQDYADVCTRIYPLGYGEGINQLTIRDVNPNKDENDVGLPYLQSPANIVAQYGIKEKVLVDRRFENAESLMQYAQTMLDALQTPSMSRSFNVVDLHPLTNQNIDNAEVGKICKMTGDDTIAYITKTVRVLDEPGNLQIELSTKATDVASTVADLADRVRIESVYAQGATQLYQHSKDANATDKKGMIMSLYFPEEMRQINKVLLRLKLGKFRSYSQTTDLKGAFTKTYTIDDIPDKEITSQTNTENKTVTLKLKNAVNTTRTWNDTFKSGESLTSNISTKEATISGSTGVKSISGSTGAKKISGETHDKTVTGSVGEGGGVTVQSGQAGGQDGVTGIWTGGASISLGDVSVDITDLDISISDAQTDNADWGTSNLGARTFTWKYNDTNFTDPSDGEPRWLTINGDEIKDDGHSHAISKQDFSHTHSFTVNSVTASGSVSIDNDENAINGKRLSGFEHSHGFHIENHSHEVTLNPHNHTWVDTSNDGKGHNHTWTDTSKTTINGQSVSGHNHTWTDTSTTTVDGKTVKGHSHTFNVKHDHILNIAHQHQYDYSHEHKFECPSHKHKITIPGHSHKIEIPNHSHNIIAGIFESGTPTGFSIYVNNSSSPVETVNATTFNDDISKWLLNSDKKIPRNTWIDIEIRPNDLAYVQSSVFVQGFVQSRGDHTY